MISIQSRDRTYGLLHMPVFPSRCMISAQPMDTRTHWQMLMAQALPSHHRHGDLRRVVGETVDTGWVAKSTYYPIPLSAARCGLHRLMGCPCVPVSSGDSASESGWDDDLCHRV